MKIGIYAEELNHFIVTIAYFISLDNLSKVLVITDGKCNREFSEHPWCLKILEQIKNVDIIPASSRVDRLDYLYLCLSSNRFLWNQELNKWVYSAMKIGCLRESYLHKTIKEHIKELVYSFPYYLNVQSVTLQDSKDVKHPFFFIRNKYFFSPSVHPQFFINKNWGKKLFEEIKDPSKSRTFKITFIGNKEPPEREATLRFIVRRLSNLNNVVLSDKFPPTDMDTEKTKILWIENDLKHPERSLSPGLYADALGDSDFSVCPLGWGGNWTHRVIESLLRGAIPIVEDEKIYNIELADMENCIVVKNADWNEAIERVSGLSLSEICRLRSNIVKLRDEYLLPEVAASRLRKGMLL
ncbi:MAG: hypothetical protein HQ549_03795 [Candidatus Omnitrophica bacterium]|nr:hypothetical protein [Candidatus Omnitrophota bacterium]